MDKNKLLDFGSKALLMLEGILFGVICMLMYFFFSEIGAVLLLLLCIAINCSMYFFLRQRYRLLMKRTADQAIGILNSLRRGRKGKIVAEPGLFEPLYYEMERLRSHMEENDKLRQNIFSIADAVAINMDFQSMLEEMLPKIMEVMDSNCGAFYVYNQSIHSLQIKYSLGFNKNIYREFDIHMGEGLIGEIARNRETKIIRDIPDDTIYTARTFLGNIKPKSIMVIPIVNQEDLLGVLVLCSIRNFTEEYMEKADMIHHYMGIAVANGIVYETNQRLTNELKFQNKLIQDFNSELEHKVAERTLLFDNVFNSIKDYAIYSMDKDGLVKTWSAGAEDLMGYSAEEVLGKNISYTYSNDEARRGVAEKRLKTVAEEGVFHEMVWRTKKDGTQYYADVAIYGIYNSDGELAGFTNVTRDITGILDMEITIKAEREFSYRLLALADRPVIIVDSDGLVQFMNPQAETLLQWEHDGGVGQPFSSLFIEKKKVEKKLLEALEDFSAVSVENVQLSQGKCGVNLKISAIQQELHDISALIIIECLDEEKPLNRQTYSSQG